MALGEFLGGDVLFSFFPEKYEKPGQKEQTQHPTPSQRDTLHTRRLR